LRAFQLLHRVQPDTIHGGRHVRNHHANDFTPACHAPLQPAGLDDVTLNGDASRDLASPHRPFPSSGPVHDLPGAVTVAEIDGPYGTNGALSSSWQRAQEWAAEGPAWASDAGAKQWEEETDVVVEGGARVTEFDVNDRTTAGDGGGLDSPSRGAFASRGWDGGGGGAVQYSPTAAEAAASADAGAAGVLASGPADDVDGIGTGLYDYDAGMPDAGDAGAR
jgi:hypothetical protein